MRRIKLGNREIDIQGSPMTPLYYKREFGQSLGADVLQMRFMQESLESFDDVNLLQMVWAMEKTAKGGRLIDFETWLGQFEYLNLLDVIAEVTEEAWDATFRDAEEKPEEPKEKPKPKKK